MAEFHIEGFGRLADVSFTDVPAGLSIVVGDNEAGKTTLLAFLRSVLFGLPSRKQKDFYPPLKGGRKGGRIVLVDGQSNRIIVERFEGKGSGPVTVTLPDGSQGGEEEFRQLIGSATADLYRNVFAFSLSELQTLDSLNTEKVRDAIYSAGVGVGPRTITEIIRDLKKQFGDLFTPGGSKPAMNKILSRVETVGRQIKDHEKDQDEYQRIQSELEVSESSIQQISSQLSAVRRRLQRRRLLQQAWEDWIALGDNREKLQTLPKIESFPEDGVKRLDALSTERRGFRDQIKEMRTKKASDEAKLAAVKTNEALLSAAEDIRRLDRSLELYEQGRQEHLSLQNERGSAEQKLADALRDLGEEWDENKLSEFDLSVPVRQEIDACRQALEEAKLAVRDCLVPRELERKENEEAVGLEGEAASALGNLPQPSKTLDVEGIRKLQLSRERYENARIDLPGVEKQCETRLTHLLDTLRKIGPNWNEERLKVFDTSLAVQEEISAHHQRLSGLRSEHRESARRAQDARQALEDSRGDLDRAEDVLETLPEPKVKDEAQLAERRRTLRALRSLLNDSEQCQARRGHLEERKQDLDAQAARLKEDLQRESFGLPAWLLPVVLVVGLIGLLTLGIGRGDWVSGGIVFGLAVIVSVLLAVAGRTSAARAKGKRTDRLNEIGDLEHRSLELQEKIEELRQGLAELDSEVKTQAESAGIESSPDGRALDEAEGLVERHLEALQRRQPAEQKRGDAKDNLAKAQDATSRANETENEKKERLNKAEEEWRQWMVETGLPETLSPENAANVLARLDAAREQLKAIESDRERIGQMMAAMREYRQQVKSVASISGFDEDIPADAGAAVDSLVACLKDHEEKVRELEEASRRLDDARKQTARAQCKTDQAKDLHRDAVKVEQRCGRQWTDLLEQLGLRSSLSVESAPQMVQAIERARDQFGRVNELRTRERVSQDSVDSYCRDVRSLIGTVGRAEPADDDVARAVSALASELDGVEKNRRLAENLNQKIKELEDGIDVLQSQIDQREHEIGELLQAANTTEEEAFRCTASDYETRRRLEDEIRGLETRLRQLVGGGEALETLEEELEHTTPENLSADQLELEDTIKRHEQEQTDAADLRGRLKEQLEQLESSEELSCLRIKQQAGRAELESGAEEWSILKIAACLIDRARMKYERERRPAVLREAERFFTQFTKGNYMEIRVPVDGDQFIVLAPDGSTKEVAQLSRGTAEQLYLALRFGFVREFVRRSEPLPLVFDDILVNFDPGRARATAEAILDLSQSLQILLFTCHPPTVELMKEVESSIPVYALKDGRFALI
ncbi:MAG: AAA family ATPase [bacterium]|nr:AAA family ATPase [bacterium]